MPHAYSSTVLALLAAIALAGCSGEPVVGPAPSGTSTPAGGGVSGSTGGGSQNHTGGGDARQSVRNPEPGAFGAACAVDTDCESNVCFLGGHGGACSSHCAADADCPAPSAGVPHCNPHGYCRY